MMSAADSRAPLEKAAGFDCEDGRQLTDKSRRGKLTVVGSIALAFLAAGMVGFFVLGPLVKDATVAKHGHSLNKAFQGGPLPSALRPVSNSPVRAVPDPVMIDKSKKIPNKLVWATFASSSELKPGEVVSGFQFGQEIAIAKTKSGKLFALSNKLPPTGQPATFGKIEGDTIIEPISSTAFKLSTGKVDGKWCPSAIGQLILQRIIAPTDVPVFKVRDQGGKLQVQVNANAKAQFEQKYWRGVLDSQGKVDGGYY